MLQLTKHSEIIGRQVRRLETHMDRVFLFFSDNSFCIISYNNGLPEIQMEYFSQEPSEFNIYTLLDLGFINKETFLVAQHRLKEAKKLSKKQ
jgi:hypothetical protein